MNRYESECVECACIVPSETGEWLKLEDVIEFIRSGEPSLLTSFYSDIDHKRVQQ